MMEMPKPQKEHQWLQRLVGEWTFENECPPGPDQPPQKFTGTESVRSLGGIWTVGEGKSHMPDDSPSLSIMTLGYDPDKKTFVGSFIASMMIYLWIYDSGQLDAAGKVLTLNAEGPSWTEPGKMVKYQDIIEFLSDDHRTLSSQTLGPDGKWSRFMEAHYHRVK